MVEIIEFKGVTYRRYPESKNRSDRVYFTPNGTERTKGRGRLHEEKWKAANGPIPDKHDIHHRDGDPLNNELANLECITHAAHMTHHHKGQATPAKRANLDRIRPLAAAWHSTPEGKAWHATQARTQYDERGATYLRCECCGKSFTVNGLLKTIARFCSNACKSEARRRSGVDDVVKACEACSKPYTANKYARGRTCSRKCAGVLISRAKTSSP